MKNIERLAKRLRLPAALLLLLPALPLRAADTSVGTQGAAFMKLPTGSARAQALGNAGVSLLEGGEAMAVNPAGIASAQMREFSFSYMGWLQEYSGRYISYVHPVGQSVVGFNLAYYGTEGFDVRGADGVPMYGADVKVRNGYASLTLAKGFFMERFLLGVSAKQVIEDNFYSEYRNTVYDVGAVLRLGRRLSLGWAGQNYSGKSNQVVRVNRFGGAWVFNPFMTVAVEQRSYSDRSAVLAGGLELNLPEELLQVGKVSLRAGYSPSDGVGRNLDDDTMKSLGMSDIRGWTFGFGIYSSQALGYGMGLDYTMAPYGALGKASQMALRFQF
jgi:hypothetical protein